MKLDIKPLVLCLSSLLALPALAAEPESCRNVRFADVGWTDIAATTGLATVVFKGLGYTPTKTIASEPIVFAGLKSKQLDVYLGYWDPSQTPAITPFVQSKSLKVLPSANLEGAKYTLAVPSYAADKGLRTFADIAKFRKELDGKIYGIEPGSQGNAQIKKMIDNNEFGLKGFKLIESSEAGMLVMATKAFSQKRPIVILAWEPHPMNFLMKLTYLSGGDKQFGPNYGGSKVYSVVANDYQQRCPNAGKLVDNLKFTLDMENHVMNPIMSKVDPELAAKQWLQRNPQALTAWLDGVTTFDGKPGLDAVKAALAQ
ncbi:choline ABC transporter substrate-binding protein [Pseudogulbenkiania subflava]|uniref:Glycine betaine/proline transport system substrate-binding protein n=1 Tax=Pseudogulbenkiania subflava DSM 22618 TaxID=1123014 RepID=A0A1Y6B6M8_9NEIS|nr:choline ABC transporter substrate-binding protein [Pseudogulbenkiania subflava]SME94802.1 glycine betaine/proline transport system substrate-binding protein [Pseudogulbenkiania subflava DSM 22618]